MKNWHLKELSSFTGRRKEGDFIDKVDFKEFF